MKKVFFNLAMATLSVVALNSCNKDQLVSTGSDSICFTASADPATKLALSGVNVLWEASDEISLYCGQSQSDGTNKYGVKYTNNLTEGETSASATFTKATGETGNAVKFESDGVEKYYALTPFAAISSWSKGPKSVMGTMPTDQKVSGPDQLPKDCGILYASSETEELSFKHVLGYVSFTIGPNSPKNIKSVKFDNKTEATHLGGTFTFDLTTATLTTRGTGSQNKTSITLAMSDGSCFGEGTYYMAMRPGTFPGAKITFTNDSDETAVVNVTKELVLRAGEAHNIGVVSNLHFGEGPVLPKVGDVYKEGTTAVGVIGYVAENYYLVLSLKKNTCLFKNARSLSGLPTDKNIVSGYDASMTLFNSEECTETIHPAAYWIKNTLGEGWYFPSNVELSNIATATKAIAGEANYTALNKILTDNGGDAIAVGVYIWTIIEQSDAKQNVGRFYTSDSNAYSVTWAVKDRERETRGIKKVSLLN